MATEDAYLYTRDQFPALLKRSFFPEKTGRESAVYRDYLTNHVYEFDRVLLQVRVGQGLTPDPTHLEGVQRQTARNSRKVIDILGWKDQQPTIIEVKERIVPAVVGQLRAYRQLFLEGNPDAPEPRLVAVGRYSDPDTLRILAAEGIDVYLYAEEVVA
jgi:hypothetical protein